MRHGRGEYSKLVIQDGTLVHVYLMDLDAGEQKSGLTNEIRGRITPPDIAIPGEK
jgi:hypothetical protein